MVMSSSSMNAAVHTSARVHRWRDDVLGTSATAAPFEIPRRRSAVLGWQGGGEKVDEQLVDALSLVVMDPMRRVGQPLDAVQVGHVIVVGLGEFGAEVVIALPPDDQGGCL